MYDLVSIKQRILRVLLDERTMVNILLGLLGILMAFGYLLSNNLGMYSYLLVQLIPLEIWAVLYLLYGTLKIHGCLYRTSIFTKFVNSALGLWLWSYLIISCLVFNMSEIRPIEFLLFATIFYELWALIIIIYHQLHPLFRRLLDAPI